jgi:predicted ATPase
VGFRREQDKEIARELRLSAIELGASPALGGNVRLDLAPQATVLVGKNGAGKSAVLERITQGARNVWGLANDPQPDPGHFACEFESQGAIRVRYECSWLPRADTVPEDAPELSIPRVEELCTVIEPDEELLWRVDDGVLTRNDGTRDNLALGGTLVHTYLTTRRGFVFPSLAGPLYDWFTSIRHIGLGAPRNREEAIIPLSNLRLERVRKSLTPVHWLGIWLARWQDEHPAEFEELLELGRRTQLLDDITIKRYVDPASDTVRPQDRKDFATVMIDGVDLGLCSDGTLRALSIFRALIEPDTKLLLIDEPESAIHPGLLARMLAEIEAYSGDRQIILSTQSPQVVSWAQPNAIRLVERRAHVTSVRSLDAETLKRVESYLHDEDTLGNFIYGGGIDAFAE